MATLSAKPFAEDKALARLKTSAFKKALVVWMLLCRRNKMKFGKFIVLRVDSKNTSATGRGPS
jgi:hypothetical protein